MTNKKELSFDYDQARKKFELAIPTEFNIAFDIVGEWAKD